jgi:hypothetical protein
MKNILHQFAKKNREKERDEKAANQVEISNPDTKDNRREFLKKTGALCGGMSLAALMFSSAEETIAQTTSKVNRSSNPSDLRITDMRYCVLQLAEDGSRNTLIRIDTNQDIYGLGEVRDAADERYALFLKSRILGENPCNSLALTGVREVALAL